MLFTSSTVDAVDLFIMPVHCWCTQHILAPLLIQCVCQCEVATKSRTTSADSSELPRPLTHALQNLCKLNNYSDYTAVIFNSAALTTVLLVGLIK